MYCTVLYCRIIIINNYLLFLTTVLQWSVLYCTLLYCTVLYLAVLICSALYCTVCLPAYFSYVLCSSNLVLYTILPVTWCWELILHYHWYSAVHTSCTWFTTCNLLLILSGGAQPWFHCISTYRSLYFVCRYYY